MKEIFTHSNGIKFYIDNNNIVSSLPKDKAIELITNVVKQSILEEDINTFNAVNMLLYKIFNSYIKNNYFKLFTFFNIIEFWKLFTNHYICYEIF